MVDDLALLIERGGFVMLLLLCLSIISLGLILERAMFWLLLHRPSRLSRLARLIEALRGGQRATVQKLAAGDRSPYARVASQMLEQGTSDAVAVEAVQRERPSLDRFMISLSTIITAAPLLGILGTVIGIIQSFRLLGEQAVLHDPKDVAGGIATALLTTALGLIIALFTLFPYMIFRGQVDRSLGRMESVIAAAQQGLDSDPRSQGSTPAEGSSSDEDTPSAKRDSVREGAPASR